MVTLHLLGGFRLHGPTGGWVGPGRPLEVELLYLLALDPDRPMTMGQLTAAMWPGMSERWAAERLPELRRDLHQRVGAAITKSGAGGWTVELHAISCDLWDLLEADQPPARLMFGALCRPESRAHDRYDQVAGKVVDARGQLLERLRS